MMHAMYNVCFHTQQEYSGKMLDTVGHLLQVQEGQSRELCLFLFLCHFMTYKRKGYCAISTGFKEL